MYKIVFTKEAAKYYKKCDGKTKRLLNESFYKLKGNPLNDANIKKLHGELNGLFRFCRALYGRMNHFVKVIGLAEEKKCYLKQYFLIWMILCTIGIRH